MELKTIKPKLKKALKKYGIKRAGVFGSYAKGTNTKKSDIDVLIEFNGSLFKLVRIERELEDKLKIKVDLLTYNGISPLLRKKILNEEVRVI